MNGPVMQRLIDDLGAAVSGPSEVLAGGVTAALKSAVGQPEWLPPDRRRASHENYARHVLHGDPAGRFSILAIVLIFLPSGILGRPEVEKV